MIILDENLQDRLIREEIARWYPGQVISITKLRPQSSIKDEAIPALLRRTNEPTFVTINTNDFWNKIRASAAYCIIAIEIPKERSLEIPRLLREIFQLETFKTKAARMGKVIHWTPTRIEYYEENRRIIALLQE
ncbi:MAG: hypothetical protein B6D41_04825 [Chloroflexi bacterium UTCFX4]|nr:MAG: hypothetical protein B6D41_04825 [Chloroflexi bacterium UTCFX4]